MQEEEFTVKGCVETVARIRLYERGAKWVDGS